MLLDILLTKYRWLIEESKYMIEDGFDNYQPWTEEFECFLDIHTRLIDLLFLIKN